ncbi:hypothetical protein BDK51DRAFT_46408 [Blyttiomyces helicus]|uniref:Uncharacterized protein n=1 Tax=Blyttiomyces helicus TaxID=388810 RepID=A0A4P9W839_9FUNG|nr:hypothetical protein BDK51DRAFT_46408 [Blyttiomyces helicus]|eukprot:RKO86326.1 hypothetical protein BDK51DRAFT_46408 [Blyttiomyces helicus]
MTDPERLAIVNFLEVKENLLLITGGVVVRKVAENDGSQTGKVGGAPKGGQAIKKTDGYKALLKRVALPISFTSYMNLYKGACKLMDKQTGYGLMPDDYYMKGFTTVEEMIADKCPYYKRLDVLFGDKQNIIAEAPLMLAYIDPLAERAAHNNLAATTPSLWPPPKCMPRGQARLAFDRGHMGFQPPDLGDGSVLNENGHDEDRDKDEDEDEDEDETLAGKTNFF